MKKRIVVLYGGRSAERKVSKQSAFSVIQAIYYDYYEVQLVFIDPNGRWFKGEHLTSPPTNDSVMDSVAPCSFSPSEIKSLGEIVFPVLHGPMGEDGTIQGFCEIIGMPYVGTGVLSSAVSMDKISTKYLVQSTGIPQLPFIPVLKKDWGDEASQTKMITKIEGSLVYPVFVKPSNMGSSVGITKATNHHELTTAINLAFQYDQRILVEQGIVAREIEVGVLGNDEIRSSCPGEIIKDVDFYDYQAKYLDHKIKMQAPAIIPEATANLIRDYARIAFELSGGAGLARCDFFLTATNEIFLNEINTMPGFTKFSMYPLLWEKVGLSYPDLIEELLQLAEKKFGDREHYFSSSMIKTAN